MWSELFSMVTVLLIGFLFGLRHAFDADHIAAMSVMVSSEKNPRNAVLRGIYWGMGHTATLLVVGFLMLIIGVKIPQSWQAGFEFIVGVMLIGLGIHALYTFISAARTHTHSHFPMGTHTHPRGSFFVGAVHGLAGSAALLIIIVSAIHSVLAGLLYILMFGAGLITSMAIFSLMFMLSAKMLRVEKIVMVGSGVLSIIGGVWMVMLNGTSL